MQTIETVARDWNCLEKLLNDLLTNKLMAQAGDDTNKLIQFLLCTIPVIKSNKLKAAAGKAVLRHAKLGPHMRLHGALFDVRDELKDQRLETFFHEIAHFVAYFTKHDTGHGVYWQYCMIHFGYAPERCFDGAVSNFRGYGKRKETREINDIIETLPEFEL